MCVCVRVCVSERKPASFALASILINTTLKFQFTENSLALMLDLFTEHNNTQLSISFCTTNLTSR